RQKNQLEGWCSCAVVSPEVSVFGRLTRAVLPVTTRMVYTQGFPGFCLNEPDKTQVSSRNLGFLGCTENSLSIHT
ncbi:MAG: hypothetical protein RBT80_27390, partial [Candidatus Vecturithrix sp.]|nr:hypothetical protein [Candidatus Vecturithrix sp.]